MSNSKCSFSHSIKAIFINVRIALSTLHCLEWSCLFFFYISENVKALFRRGKAYAELVEGAKARSDLSTCVALDPSLLSACTRLLDKLAVEEKKHNNKDKKLYSNLFS